MAGLLNRESGEDTAHVLTWRPVTVEREILYVLDSRPAPGEPLEMAFRRKEAELKTLFAGMGFADNRELHRRLSLAIPDDPIAAKFVGLIAPRRSRLLSFLADARRRLVVGGR